MIQDLQELRNAPIIQVKPDQKDDFLKIMGRTLRQFYDVSFLEYYPADLDILLKARTMNEAATRGSRHFGLYTKGIFRPITDEKWVMDVYAYLTIPDFRKMRTDTRAGRVLLRKKEKDSYELEFAIACTVPGEHLSSEEHRDRFASFLASSPTNQQPLLEMLAAPADMEEVHNSTPARLYLLRQALRINADLYFPMVILGSRIMYSPEASKMSRPPRNENPVAEAKMIRGFLTPMNTYAQLPGVLILRTQTYQPTLDALAAKVNLDTNQQFLRF